MTMQTENTPAEVRSSDKQSGGGEQLRWQLGAELCAWTERMLAALVKGVKGGKWFSLHDKTYSPKTLRAAWEQVKSRKGCAGIDKVSIGQFERHAETELMKLHNQLREGTYRPQPVKRVFIPKLGSHEKRPLGIPCVRDRIVQTALVYVIQPIFEKEFHANSFGFRPHRGCKDALREVEHLLKKGYEWIVDVDLKGYFDTINHDALMERVKEKIADGDTLKLIELFLKQGVAENGEEPEPHEEGTPQGAVVSPLLSNLFLNELDWQMNESGFRMIRYADDIIVVCESEAEARKALAQVKAWAEANKLIVHPTKTRIVHHNDKGGFEFLGYRFERGKRFPRAKSLKKLREKIRKKTKRTQGKRIEEVIEGINPILKGWFGYFKHAYKTTFPSIDGWVRMRLRSILRKNEGKEGRGRGSDHQKWRNAYFSSLGLYSLKESHSELCQSR